MKTKMIVFILLFFPLNLIAQKKNPLQKEEKEWKFAAGVTLLSNRDYTDYLQKRSPLELNFKYRISGNHFVSASGIISLKNDVHQYPEEFNPNKNLDIMEYLEIVRKNSYTTIVTVDNYYDLYGGDIGYNYSYHLCKSISIFGGTELGYYRQHWIDKHFSNGYNDAYGNSVIDLNTVHYENININYNIFSIKPQAGIMYSFKNLLLEAEIGYPFSYVNRQGTLISDSWYGDEIINHAPRHTKFEYKFSQFIYKLSIYYTL